MCVSERVLVWMRVSMCKLRMYVCICVCMYVCLCIYMCLCICVYTCMCVCKILIFRSSTEKRMFLSELVGKSRSAF